MPIGEHIGISCVQHRTILIAQKCSDRDGGAGRDQAKARGGYAMTKSSKFSRRQFLHAGTTGVAATVVAATKPARAGEPELAVKAPPPPTPAPRILRKPPLSELERIARSYGLELSQD